MLQVPAADKLVAIARGARAHAYAPYSGFAVGAAVLCADGRIFAGCNIENVSLGATVCAERVALFTARAAGAEQIVALAVAGPGAQPTPPCGICRQVLAELAPQAVVVMAGESGPWRLSSVAELLPEPFAPAALGRGAGAGEAGGGERA